MNPVDTFYPTCWYSPAYWYHPAVPMLPPPPPPRGVPVRSVWAYNLNDELRYLRYFAARACYVAINVQYPGVVYGADQDHNVLGAEERFAIVKANVDALKPLQVGLAISTHDGRLVAWEFNLSDFNPGVDPCVVHSISYLAGRGLDFDAHHQHGVPMARLAAALNFSGLIHRRRAVSWITHTGAYHVAYLMKLKTGGNELPDDLAGFFAAVRRYLGEDVYDVARLARDWADVLVELERMAVRFGVPKPLLSPKLAGASSLLAVQAYVALGLRYGPGDIKNHRGVLHGLQAT